MDKHELALWVGREREREREGEREREREREGEREGREREGREREGREGERVRENITRNVYQFCPMFFPLEHADMHFALHTCTCTCTCSLHWKVNVNRIVHTAAYCAVHVRML